MKDLYKTLGLTQDASSQEVKKAFRKQALISHPDKGGDVEMMRLLNEAYETLSDPDKRRRFDADWSAFQEADVSQGSGQTVNDFLEASNAPPYSKSFREEHNAFVTEYKSVPLQLGSILDNFRSFESNQYRFEMPGTAARYFHDIFTYISHKTIHDVKNSQSYLPPTQPLSLTYAVKIFIDFITGNYYGTGLIELKRYLLLQVDKERLATPKSPAFLFYEGIIEIVLMSEKRPEDRHHLIHAIKKISDFAKATSDLDLSQVLPIFYNKYFRNLYAYSLHLYWLSNKGLFENESLKKFDGQCEAKELLEVLRSHLTDSRVNDDLGNLVRYIKLLYILEKDLNKMESGQKTSWQYREKAFRLLDWVPALTGKSSGKIIANVFLQIGINFQQASRLELNPAIKMADEKIAFKMYLTSVSIGHHSTPDVEIYTSINVLKYLSGFQFQDPILKEVIHAFQKRILVLTDVFPFFDDHQSNIALLRDEDKPIQLMRRLLNAMMGALEYNKKNSTGIAIDHSTITILYQVYEACLKNWYQEKYDPATEKKIRLELMEELLFDKGWTFLDVEQNVDSPWIMVNRDKSGWMKPTRSLPYKEDEEFIKYRSINGAEVDYNTGEIKFFLDPWNKELSEHEKLFTLYDLQEMLEKNLGAAIFSLDPVDPDKPYHPFNAMRFAPDQLGETELFNSMLLTDYILKFLTTNQEVQGQYPYEQRPVDKMIEHLPKYLRAIIDDFHRQEHTGAKHRFWIEAEEIDVEVSEPNLENDHTVKIGLGELKMVVKKHRMERDIHGVLKDVGNEDEGWPIYVLTSDQMTELKCGIRKINGHAMIFIHADNRLLFWENNRILKNHIPENFRETLIRLYSQPKDKNGKIEPQSTNTSLLYRTIKTMATQSGLPHRYSPEFIFAHEFTTHYDEFAQYLPEFGRLRELSKMSALVRFLNGMRKSNKEHIEALDVLLNPPFNISKLDTEAYKAYSKIHEQLCEKTTSMFQKIKLDVGPGALYNKWTTKLIEIQSHIGTLDYSSYSMEVNEACKTWHDKISRENPGVFSSRIWREVIDPKRAEVAQQLSDAKKESCRKQLREIFSYLTNVDELISLFMRGKLDPLANALINRDKLKAQEEVRELFPKSSTQVIASALEGSSYAVAQIAKDASHSQLREIKQTKDTLESGFVVIGLAKDEKPAEVQGRCLWVPASVNHDVRSIDASGLARHSFFVYGGVSIQPNLNVIKGGGGPIGGSPVGGGSFNRSQITQGFQSHHIISHTNPLTKNHPLLQLAGVNNLNARVNRIYLPTHESLHPTRSIHSGRHTTVAMKNIAGEMDKIVEYGRAQNWSQAQYREAFRTTLSGLRQELRAGNVALNVIHRPWSN